MWKAICFPARKNCAIIHYYPGTSLFNCKVIDNKIHLSLPLFLVFKHHSCYFYYCCYEYVMKGSFIIMLAGIPLSLRKKLYPQKLSVFSQRRLNGTVCTSHFPIRQVRTWGGVAQRSCCPSGFKEGAFSQVMLNGWWGRSSGRRGHQAYSAI